MGSFTDVPAFQFLLTSASMPMTESKLGTILLVDDNEKNIVFIRQTFEHAGLNHPIYSVTSGAECLSYLSAEPPFDDREKFPVPVLVLLDLNMQAIDGLHVLRWIRRQPQFEKLRVVTLTSSDEIRKGNLAYQLGADSFFFVKPLEFCGPRELVHSVEHSLSPSADERAVPQTATTAAGQRP
jgi:CheY-like chemotaxis protein